MIDFGALVDGYCSDMTRTVMVGEPTPTQARMLDVVARRAAGRRRRRGRGVGVRRGRRGLPRRHRPRPAGATAFSHGTGHGVGLEIHEAPAGGVDGRLLRSPPAHVVTVEPGVYLPEHGGVRIEDTVRRHRRRLPAPHPRPEALCHLTTTCDLTIRT